MIAPLQCRAAVEPSGTYPGRIVAGQARNALGRLGIPCVLHNEYAAFSVVPGASGHLNSRCPRA